MTPWAGLLAGFVSGLQYPSWLKVWAGTCKPHRCSCNPLRVMGSYHLYPVAEHGPALGAQYFPPPGLLFGMDYSAWPPENAFQAELGDLNLLEPPAPQAAAGDALFSLQGELRPSVEEERVAKRSREAIERESLESFLRELAKEPAEPGRSEPHQSSSGDEKRAAGRHSTDAAAAARAKAGRERARRERLNEVCHLTLGPVYCQCLAGVLMRRAVFRVLLFRTRHCRGLCMLCMGATPALQLWCEARGPTLSFQVQHMRGVVQVRAVLRATEHA